MSKSNEKVWFEPTNQPSNQVYGLKWKEKVWKRESVIALHLIDWAKVLGLSRLTWTAKRTTVDQDDRHFNWEMIHLYQLKKGPKMWNLIHSPARLKLIENIGERDWTCSLNTITQICFSMHAIAISESSRTMRWHFNDDDDGQYTPYSFITQPQIFLGYLWNPWLQKTNESSDWDLDQQNAHLRLQLGCRKIFSRDAVREPAGPTFTTRHGDSNYQRWPRRLRQGRRDILIIFK